MSHGELVGKLDKLVAQSKASLGLQFAHFALGWIVELLST